MRRALLTVLAAITLAGIVPSSGFAQSAIVDLSKPQTGKSEFVLNSDFTAANLGVAPKEDDAKKTSSSAVSDWCASGCRMLPPQAAAQDRPGQRNVVGSQTANRSSVVVVSTNTRQDGTAAATPKRSSSGFKVGRRRR